MRECLKAGILLIKGEEFYVNDNSDIWDNAVESDGAYAVIVSAFSAVCYGHWYDFRPDECGA